MEEIRAIIVAGPGGYSPDEGYVTRADVEAMIVQKLASLKIYVSEADISSAQENAKTIADNSEF